ncbi:MAG: ATPase, T2SS/T4P/T4SS family [Candidatus Neomarinimicrobiota bacterium]
MAIRSKKPLGQMLVEGNKISKEELAKALEYQKEAGTYLGKALINLEIISEEEFDEFLGEQLGIPLINLGSYEVSRDALELLPDKVVRKHKVLPLFEIEGVLSVAVSDPLDDNALDAVARETGLNVEPVLALSTDIDSAIDVYYGISKIIGDIDTDDFVQASDQVALEELADETKIVALVDGLIKQAVKYLASDIHIEARENDIRVRLRIDGKLQDFHTPPKSLHLPLLSRLKIMSGLDIAETRRPQDGRIHLSSDGRRLDLRFSTFPTYYGEKAVLRVLDVEKAKLKLDELGFEPNVMKTYGDLISSGEGVILFSGPTGSGKTTTLYATLNTINSPTKNIVTIEDPIEYELVNINQAQVNRKAGLTFAAALRSILRQDPDIIMVGEIRDEETVELAIRAALTGHLVFSTIHTNDAAGGFARLRNWEMEPFLITSTIKAIIAQRLIRKLCLKCRKPYAPPPEELRKLGLEENGEYTFYKATGCLSCRNAGYTGRIGLFELLVMTPTIGQMVTSNESAQEIRKAAENEGMVTLFRDGTNKVVHGITSFDEFVTTVSATVTQLDK